MTRDRSGSTRPQLESLEDRLVPSTMAGSYPDGVWRYDTSAGWNHISDRTAIVLHVDDTGDVYGAFSDGLWRWDATSTSWAHLSNLNIQQFRVTAAGVLYGDFGTQGVWRWDASGWMQLTALDVGQMAVSNSDAFFGRFDETGAQGTWRWTPAAGWSLLTGNRPDQLQTDAAGDMVGLFNTFIASGQQGTWRWNPTAGWARLSTTAPENISVSLDGAIFENQGTNGIWRAAPGASFFTQIDATDETDSSFRALPDGGLYLNNHDAAIGHFVGDYWNGGVGFVTIISDATSIVLLGVGKDGDLFFDGFKTGTGYWSLESAYHTLTGNSEVPTTIGSQR
jgi:hypothetical protein